MTSSSGGTSSGKPENAVPGIFSEKDLSSPYESDADLREIIVQFVLTLEKDMPALRASTEKGDMPALVRLAHRFKGSAKVLGFEALGRLFSELEDQARAVDEGKTRAGTQGTPEPKNVSLQNRQDLEIREIRETCGTCERLQHALALRFLSAKEGVEQVSGPGLEAEGGEK
jgi:HPt (histidine-containing phosphotransfer) domain-containing protein